MSGDGEGGLDGSEVSPFLADGQLGTSRLRYARRLAARGRVAALDRLAALATRVLGSAAAQVSLVDDAQTVIGGAGLAAGSVGSRTAATDAICSLVVSTNDVVRVDDALADDRTARLPPVASGVVGAYLGVPLTSAGHTVGALCVFDPVPRAWTDDDTALLASVAQSVVVELELAALEAEYEDERTVWQLAIDAGGVGAFDWNLVTGELRWDERLLELFGLDRDSFGGTIEAFNAAVHPDDRDRVAHALTEAITTCGQYAAEYRVLLPNGDLRWIAARGRALVGPDGVATRLLGAASDTTALQDQEARVARVLESMPTAFFSLDRDWRFTYANGEANRLLGGIGADVVGHVIWDLFPAAVGSEFETQYRRAAETGEPVTFQAYYPPPLDAWYEVRAWPSPDGLAVYFLDISERRTAQETASRAARRATLLGEVGTALSGTLDVDEAVQRLAQLIVPELGEWCVVTLVEHGDLSPTDWRRGLRDIACWHADPQLRPVVERYSQLRLAALANDSFLANALTGRRTIVVPDAADRVAAVLRPGEARDLLVQLAPSSAVAVPLVARGRTAGILSVFRDRDRRPLSQEGVAILEEIAARAGLALDNARLYGEQRDLAEALQRSLMTAPPEPDHLHVAVRYTPAAQAAQVGGDWYDAFLQPNGATTVVIGDVVGHDTVSAAAMGQLRNVLRGVAVITEASPAQLLKQVDTAMTRLQIETTATVVIARLEQTPAEREQGLTRLRWSNAGHPPPIVVTHSGHDQSDEERCETDPVIEADVLWGPQPNLLLGLEPEAERDETVVTLPRGSTVLLYTDGLVERRGELIDVGIARLGEVLTELVRAELPLEDLCDEVLRRMLPAKPDDDVALVAVRLHREDQPRPAEAGPTDVPRNVPQAPPAPSV